MRTDASLTTRPTPPPTLHEGLEAVRDGRAAEPAAVAACTRLARAHGTPLYVYDRATILGQIRSLKAAFAPRFPKLEIHYALKANGNPVIVGLLWKEGIGAEVVSIGEIVTAERVGVPGADILFTSSSKAPSEIEKAIAIGAILNVDSLDELEQASAASRALGKTVRISFRINPGVDPLTLRHINTGITESKFGVHLEGGIAFHAYERAKALPGLRIVGAHCHIGSQITGTEGYVATLGKMLAFVKELKDRLSLTLEFVDLGGGLGIPYEDGETGLLPEALAAALQPVWREGVARLGYEPALWLEPGRFFVGPAGILLARVNTVKTTPVTTFVNVDAGSNTLLRPALYQASHRVRIVGREDGTERLDIAGDVCETGDILAAGRDLPRPAVGDLVAILDAGAYGFSMASEYNARPLPAEVLVDGDTATLIRRRGSFEDLFRNVPTL